MPLSRARARLRSRPMRSLVAVLVLSCAAVAPVAAWGVPADSPRRTPVVEAVARATPAVVAIQVEATVRSPFMFFGPQRATSEGSGVIIASDGVVLTNAHVVDGAHDVRVLLADGRAFPATVVALDADADLAVLRLAGATGLPVLPLGDSDDLLLGETVIAIGNPLGLGLTVSTGVVASTARDLPVGNGPVQTWIQTDAAINPGNSGGALVDLEGRLIGINTFIRRDAEGVGFAIPAQRARKIAGDLLAFGSVQLPWLGVVLADGRAPSGEPVVVVASVAAEGPGAKAGLAPGDRVLSLDGHRVSSRADINARLAERAPGTVARVEVARQGGAMSARVTTGRPPDDAGRVARSRALGVGFAPAQGGVVATEVNPQGSWARAGLLPGDLLFAVDGQPVSGVEDLEARLTAAVGRHRGSVWVAVARGPHRGTLELSLR